MSRIGYLAAVLCAAPLMATAAESAADAARHCSQVIGERERLACYDRAFPAGPQTSGPAATPTPPAAASFGEDSIRKPPKAEDRSAPREPETLTAQITQIRETRPNVWRLTLDNGQVWQQMDMSGSFLPKAGNTLRIEKGRFGGYSAALMGETRSSWVRMTRVQ